MGEGAIVFVLYLIVIIIVGAILYSLITLPEPALIYSQLPQPSVITTHHWGYGWRPYWRRRN